MFQGILYWCLPLIEDFIVIRNSFIHISFPKAKDAGNYYFNLLFLFMLPDSTLKKH